MDFIIQSAPKVDFNEVISQNNEVNSLVDMAKHAQETYAAIESPQIEPSSKGIYAAIESPQIKVAAAPSFKGTSFKGTDAAIESPQIKVAAAPSFAELPPQGHPPLENSVNPDLLITKPTSPLDEETLTQKLKKQETAVKNKRLIKIGVAVAVGVVILIFIVKHFKK